MLNVSARRTALECDRLPVVIYWGGWEIDTRVIRCVPAKASAAARALPVSSVKSRNAVLAATPPVAAPLDDRCYQD